MVHRLQNAGASSSETSSRERRIARWCGRLALLAFAVAALIVGACQSERPRPESASEATEPVQIVENLALRESRAGVTRWSLLADSAMSYTGSRRTFLHGVHVDFYSPSGDSVQSTLTAREGEVDEKSGDLLARGSVVVKTSRGQTLETEELRWDNQRGKVISDQFVRLTKGESIVSGIGIESDAELKSYVIRSAVQGTVREEDRISDGF